MRHLTDEHRLHLSQSWTPERKAAARERQLEFMRTRSAEDTAAWEAVMRDPEVKKRHKEGLKKWVESEEYRKQVLGRTIHGHSLIRGGKIVSKTYRTWIIRKSNPDFWAPWLDFLTFLSDVGTQPHRHRLAKLDLSKPWSPENAAWVRRGHQRGQQGGKPRAYNLGESGVVSLRQTIEEKEQALVENKQREWRRSRYFTVTRFVERMLIQSGFAVTPSYVLEQVVKALKNNEIKMPKTLVCLSDTIKTTMRKLGYTYSSRSITPRVFLREYPELDLPMYAVNVRPTDRRGRAFYALTHQKITS